MHMNIKNTSESTSSGIGFCGLLTIVLIALKLMNLISISWVWVWAPIWLPIAVALTIGAIVLVVALLFHGVPALIDMIRGK